MERKTIVNEEAEPPGDITGMVGLENLEDSAFDKPKSYSAPSIVPIKSARDLPRFKDSPQSRDFRRHFFPKVTLAEWQDWRWQLRNRIRDVQTLGQILWLSEEERHAMVQNRTRRLPVTITPYYASLIDRIDISHPLRRTVVPVTSEDTLSAGETSDPLSEEKDSPVPCIVHRYPDRVLFLMTSRCSTYCRYCTRSRIVSMSGENSFGPSQWDEAISYIAANHAVRDVLLSGGDPLTLSDGRLEWILSRLKKIPHVELIRIGTKAPVVMPFRITPELTRVLKRYHPIWISLHVTHPEELTPEMQQACIRLADAGIPLGSQTVLLAGINDNLDTMKRLFHGLLQIRVRPYYLYQCDPIPGSSHFRTPVSKGLEIIKGLRGHTTGYAVPAYVIDAPGGGGKIPLLPEYVLGRNGHDLLLKNYQGRTYRYPDCLIPAGEIN